MTREPERLRGRTGSEEPAYDPQDLIQTMLAKEERLVDVPRPAPGPRRHVARGPRPRGTVATGRGVGRRSLLPRDDSCHSDLQPGVCLAVTDDSHVVRIEEQYVP